MNAASRWRRRPVFGALIVWFVHFVLCWAVVEVWPHTWRANALAWGFTAVALLLMGLQFVRLQGGSERGELVDFTRRMERGATVIASLAILFTALPTIVFLPRFVG